MPSEYINIKYWDRCYVSIVFIVVVHVFVLCDNLWLVNLFQTYLEHILMVNFYITIPSKWFWTLTNMFNAPRSIFACSKSGAYNWLVVVVKCLSYLFSVLFVNNQTVDFFFVWIFLHFFFKFENSQSWIVLSLVRK